MGSDNHNGSKGSAGCGCFMLIAVVVVWGISLLIFPKFPDYDEAMKNGELVPGEVLRIDVVENVTINEKHPKSVVFSYGDNQEGIMRMALNESARPGQALQVRVLGNHAYPEGIKPFRRPTWLNYAMIAGIVIGVISLTAGIARLLLIGGVLFAAGRSLTKKQQNPQTPPPPPLPPPPAG